MSPNSFTGVRVACVQINKNVSFEYREMQAHGAKLVLKAPGHRTNRRINQKTESKHPTAAFKYQTIEHMVF